MIQTKYNNFYEFIGTGNTFNIKFGKSTRAPLTYHEEICWNAKYIEANKISVIVTLNPIITFAAMAVIGSMSVDWIDAEVTTIYGVIGALIVVIGAVLVVLPKKAGIPQGTIDSEVSEDE